MKCPYCGEEMELGMIESSDPLGWKKEKTFVNRPSKKRGEIMLAKPAMFGHGTVDAYLCRECRKIIISY